MDAGVEELVKAWRDCAVDVEASPMDKCVLVLQKTRVSATSLNLCKCADSIGSVVYFTIHWVHLTPMESEDR